jgi:hypothetical protein
MGSYEDKCRDIHGNRLPVETYETRDAVATYMYITGGFLYHLSTNVIALYGSMAVGQKVYHMTDEPKTAAAVAAFAACAGVWGAVALKLHRPVTGAIDRGSRRLMRLAPLP